MRTTILLTLMLTLVGPANAQNADARLYFSLNWHVFEGHVAASSDQLQSIATAEKRVQSALDEVSALLGYQTVKPVDSKTWMVMTSGDMERVLDYRGTSIRIAEAAEVQFSLAFDSQRRFLTLFDLVLTSRDNVLLHTSLGIEDRGTAVAGVMEPTADGREFFIVLTFDVSSSPFPGQSTDAVFTVLTDDEHH